MKVLILIGIVFLVLFISGCSDGKEQITGNVVKEPTAECKDECYAYSCSGFDYYSCLVQEDGCKDKVYEGKRKGLCGVECFSKEDCIDLVCSNFKCINDPVKIQEQRTYQLGESIQAGDFKWKITKFTTVKEIGEEILDTFFGKKADGIFLIVDVEVENTGNSAQILSDSFVKLVDPLGREFSADSTAAIYLEPQGSSLLFEQINPGIKKKGRIVYDIPEDIGVVNIRISQNFLSDSFYNIKMVI